MHNRLAAIIALWDAYHGSTFAAASLSWIATQASGHFTGQTTFLPMLHTVHRAPNPYCYRCVFNQQPESCDLSCAEMFATSYSGASTGRQPASSEPLRQRRADHLPCATCAGANWMSSRT
jgi:4-aminobutyrate aminotransferase-like enzyme